MQLFEIQFAWFFNHTNYLDYEQLVSSFRQKTKRPFISPATYIPLPPMAPPEIPRAQLQTLDNSSRLSISLNRADFFISSTTNSILSEHEVESFYEDINSFSEIMLLKSGIIRLGMVGRMYKESSNPSNEIVSCLLKREFKSLQEASVKFVERHVANKFTYNDSFQFDQGLKLDTQKKILVVTRDINTAPEVQLIVSMEVIKEFCLLAKERLHPKYINDVMGA